MDNVSLAQLAAMIPQRPHGHIDNGLRLALTQMAARPVHDLEGLAALNGLVARDWRLANAPPPEHDPTPPVGGTPSAGVVDFVAA